MRRFIVSLIIATAAIAISAQEKVDINISANKASGFIDPLIYGQLFEHIYFSANNGVWQELIYERSFEPEHYPGIPPRDGYFDGWFMDDENILHSPTRYEQPLKITSVESDEYEISMDVNWRAYKLASRAWSGGLMDIRFAVKDRIDGEPYFIRIHDPFYEARTLNTAQTEAQIEAANIAQERLRALAGIAEPYFSISTMVEKETQGYGGRTRKTKTLESLISKSATASQINDKQEWHKLRISCKKNSISVYWDGKRVLNYNKLEATGKNDIVFWVNYTETLYKNIKVTSSNGKTTYFEGTPEDVKIPAVAPQWESFGNAEFEMVKGDAINMDYSQKIKATSKAGVSQGPQNLIPGETFVGSIYAKGNGKLSVGLKRGNSIILEQQLGTPGTDWKKFDINIPVGELKGDADFAICVENGTVQIDQVTLSTATGQSLGGFRPDILQAVKDLHPTCLRWPGGGYVAQYKWKWGIGPQE
jgi:alpha-N-arabinofuranosidase